MTRRISLLALFVGLIVFGLLSSGSPAGAATRGASGKESKRLARLLEQGWEQKLRDRPEFATYIGFPGHNHRWTDLSAAGAARREAWTRAQIKALRAIDRSALPPDEQRDLDLYLRRLEGQLAGFEFPEAQLAITPYDGISSYLATVFAIAPAASSRDYEDQIARLQGIAPLVDQSLANLAQGLAAGVTPPKVLLVEVPEQLRALIPDDPWQSPLLVHFRQISGRVEDEEAARLRGAALFAYERKAAPALRRLLTYLTSTYLPAARESIGLGALPRGDAWYAERLQRATTTNLSPQAVHDLGFAEVRRLRAAMDRIRIEMGFEGSFEQFVRFLRSDPRFFYTAPEDLLAGYRALAKRVEMALPRVFGTIPTLPVRIAAVPAEGAEGKSAIYYEPGSVARGVPGTCYVNTSNLSVRAKWEMAALYLHECLPGHHLQVTLAQSIRKAPRVLNYHDYTPFVEGWGVYAETLGDELGVFDDPTVKFGQLTSELWRAMRVVVDTGIHAHGWTRQQALEVFRRETAQDDRAIEIEIQRYLFDPGLGTAYTMGAVKFRELRAFAERELGAAFDLRQFHDEILRHGALPLDLLEENVRAWVEARKGGGGS